MAKVLLLHGPNLNLLGEREPDIYGPATLKDIEDRVREAVEAAGHDCWCYQSNSEGGMIDWLQEARPADFLLVNAGAYTHTSVALRDAISSLMLPFVEIHISNIYKREPFRHHSYLADIAVGSIVGLGVKGYELAVQYALEHLKSPGKS